MTRDELLERGDETVTLRQIVDRFETVEEEYSGMPWTLKQIYTQIDMLVSNKPCGDCISRERVSGCVSTMYYKGLGKQKSLEYILKYIDRLPAVSPMPKMGKWIYIKKEDSYKCNLCGFPCHKDNLGAIPTKYCAGCGARMEDAE